MKAIINGRRYDTDAPQTVLVCTDWNGCSRDDFGFQEEKLYRTGKGNWFLYGRGGPLTKYSEGVGNNSYSGSSRIVPMTAAEAKAWLEEGGATDEIEEWFADEIEDA